MWFHCTVIYKYIIIKISVPSHRPSVYASSVNMFKNKIDKYLVKAGYYFSYPVVFVVEENR